MLIFAFVLALLGIAVWGVTSFTASAKPEAIPSPTYAPPYAHAEIVKPTYTPVPTQIPTNTPEPVAESKIVVDTSIYASAQSDLNAPAPVNTDPGKVILVDISEQHMYVYDDGNLTFSFVASTGIHNATRTGSFSVLDKIPNAYGATWDIWMPNWLGIYQAGSLENGIHALPILSNGATLWAGYLGTPISFGCVVLGTEEAQTLYDWAEVGTRVDIQW